MQLTVVEKSPEFTIRELFWVTEYCLSVEPSLANRPVPTSRTDEQCVTTGHRDSKWDTGRGSHGMQHPPASWPWECGDPCQGPLGAVCLEESP